VNRTFLMNSLDNIGEFLHQFDELKLRECIFIETNDCLDGSGCDIFGGNGKVGLALVLDKSLLDGGKPTHLYLRQGFYLINYLFHDSGSDCE
jgi:hypothetical protein